MYNIWFTWNIRHIYNLRGIWFNSHDILVLYTIYVVYVFYIFVTWCVHVYKQFHGIVYLYIMCMVNMFIIFSIPWYIIFVYNVHGKYVYNIFMICILNIYDFHGIYVIYIFAWYIIMFTYNYYAIPDSNRNKFNESLQQTQGKQCVVWNNVNIYVD